MISLEMHYNIHIVDRNYTYVQTTQLKPTTYPLEQTLGRHLRRFMPSHTWWKMKQAIDNVLRTGIPEWIVYDIKNRYFLALIDRIDDNKIAVHEVFDDPENRDMLKKKLWVASGNFHRQLEERGGRDSPRPSRWEGRS